MLDRHAQRQHIIASLDALLYQLDTLAFFFAPSLLPYLCRLLAQSQCSKPKDDDTSHSLRFYLILIVLLNLPSLWYHFTRSSFEDRAVVLDFVGLAYAPSKLQLITLDALIIFLQILLATIAYETALSVNTSEPDIFAPLPPSSRAEAKDIHSQYVIDMRFRPFLSRLRNPPPIRQSPSLPLPNTAPWSLPTGMGLALMRAGRRMRTGGNNRPGGRDRRFPGTLDNQADSTNT
ncbi:hypothetical protein AX15_002810 [Amanita polypyramis BW_CC]|nr:hypothetical protein AX15_002810 [Amanita polypyramis BW_CC]